MIGVVNVYKEKGFTSHDVVAIMRRVAGTKKVGHTGTLDPDATGVLPICIGRATKLAENFAAADKTYIAEIVLGIETTTGDISGEIITRENVNISREILQEAVDSFHVKNHGVYMQVPPMFSAIKIGGKKMYEIARKGEKIDIPPRPVTIHDIALLNFTPEKNTFTIKVTCSKGTYIRSLAVDIGKKLGTCGTMGALERTQSGIFTLDTAHTLDVIKTTPLADILMPIDSLLPYPKITLPQDMVTHALNGNPLPNLNVPPGEKVWLCTQEQIIGLYKADSKKLRVEVML